MGLLNDFFNNTRKPEGTLGELMVGTMNDGHAELASWGAQFIDVSPEARVLDVGCGGGANVASFLMRCDKGRADGVDYSEVSVAASKKLNERAINEGRCRIEQASVEALPFEDAAYDLVTAHETVYFWPDLSRSFAEVARVLAPGGRFMVINESTGSDASSEYFATIIEGMSLYSAEQIGAFMEGSGLGDIVIHTRDGKPWTCVIGTKPGGASAVRLREAGPDYANWVPKGMAYGMVAGGAALGACAVGAAKLRAPKLVTAVLGAAAASVGAFAIWCFMARKVFSYDGARKLSKQIVEGTASYISLPEGGVCLDVGCGSGALSIAVAKRNPQARVVGIDTWGPEYASFSKAVCERNAAAEGVDNAEFRPGNAVKLPFADGAFDAVTSNYVYHNVTGADKQALLRETLRCLKKGGSFAIHDIMSPARYGDTQAFCQSLRDEGYQDVRLVPTDDGLFMGRVEGMCMMLSGSALLVGTK